MRASRTVVALGLLAGAVLVAAPPVQAKAEKKGTFPGLKLSGKLTTDDPRDKVQRNSYSKSHPFQMDAGRIYRIDAVGKEPDKKLDPFLRLAGPDGNDVAYDDDSGGGLNARIVYRPTVSGEYKIIVTTSQPNQTGKYGLSVSAGTPEELAEWRAANLFQLSAAERKETISAIRKTLEAKGTKLSGADAELAFQVAMSLEAESPAEAAEVYKTFGKLLAGSSEAKVAEMAKTFAGAGRRVDLVGHEMMVKGKTPDGKELNWKSYRGKVVLVDFWATWCGPCRAEIPNIKAMYEKYHGAGFDVVGISMDRSKPTLEKFMQKENLPWVSTYDADAGQGESMADYYGIFAIPQAILVGRDGRVISLNARGQELVRLLEKHLAK